ncbi:acetylornithine deacetylase [Ancylobacter amanitiformis]|uniref:Acetylornithine deacetylase n=1 Tax=Ancylobacter amanitiformis TaxID=217069 RepID=A0ABU0LTC9_9HYPH|nr:acetylornithine deacetylase [Ancylobacter amanitiformis]MDQ0511952.1 acetylornithine deacetylase [Ancylobacter amanitiformis]
MLAGRTTTEELLAHLVAFDTTSRNSNLALIGFVRDYLEAYGVASVIVPSEDGRKASLFATIGPAEIGGVCLSGHSDVVPVDGQPWSTDPFELTPREDRLYGRGSCDMKGFVATCLALVPQMTAANLSTPIHLLVSYDEEIGCTGVVPAVRRLGVDLPLPRACIVGEPTSMRVVDAHKSGIAYLTTVTGREAHSSMPQLGANAIFAAAELVGELDRYRAELIEAGDASGRFDPPNTTVQVTVIDGGTAGNIVPRQCGIRWNVRGLPDFDEPTLLARFERFAQGVVLPKLRASAPEASIVTDFIYRVPPLRPQTGSEAELLALRLAGQNRTYTVSYGTEGGHFQAQGIPTVICGPGSIDQAHKPDEFIEVAQLRACERFLTGLVAECAK